MQKLKDNEIILLSHSVLRALTQNRIKTIIDFLQEDVNKLSAITKLNIPEILSMRNDIYGKYSGFILNGTTLLDKTCNFICENYIKTGLERLDIILEGGIPIGYISELCGIADSGKTQLCFQFAINCARNSLKSVLFIDTKGDFSALRIQKILRHSRLTNKEMAHIMYRIKIVRVWTLEEAIDLLQNIKNKNTNIENLAMIIVDSLPCLMFQFLGDENKIGLSMLNTFVNYSRYICQELKVCMVIVNIQTRWVDQDIPDINDEGDSDLTKEMFNEKRIRSLGRYWQHIPYLILSLERPQDCATEDTGEHLLITVMKSNKLQIQSRKCSLYMSAFNIL